MDEWVGGWVDRWVDGAVSEWIDGRTYGWSDGLVNGIVGWKCLIVSLYSIVFVRLCCLHNIVNIDVGDCV